MPDFLHFLEFSFDLAATVFFKNTNIKRLSNGCKTASIFECIQS